MLSPDLDGKLNIATSLMRGWRKWRSVIRVLPELSASRYSERNVVYGFSRNDKKRIRQDQERAGSGSRNTSRFRLRVRITDGDDEPPYRRRLSLGFPFRSSGFGSCGLASPSPSTSFGSCAFAFPSRSTNFGSGALASSRRLGLSTSLAANLARLRARLRHNLR